MGDYKELLYSTIVSVQDGYEKGLNSPNNIKRVFILNNFTGVQFHLGVGKGYKRLNIKPVTDSGEVEIGGILNCLLIPRVCSSIEEILISKSVCDNLPEIVNRLTSGGTVQLMNRFPRLRNIAIVLDCLDTIPDNLETALRELGSIDGQFGTLSDYLSMNDLLFDILETKNNNWYDRTYYRKYKYTFDEKIEVLFDKIQNAVEKHYRTEKLEDIDKKLGVVDVNKYFEENKDVVVSLYNTIVKVLGGDTNKLKTELTTYQNELKLQNKCTTVIPNNFETLKEPFNILHKFYVSVFSGGTDIVSDLDTAKNVIVNMVNFEKVLVHNSKDSEVLAINYLSVLDDVVITASDVKLKVGIIENLKRTINEKYGLSLSELIDPSKVYELLGATDAIFECLDINNTKGIKQKLDTLVRVFEVSGFKKNQDFILNLETYTNALHEVLDFIKDYSNWDINLALQQHFYLVLIKDGFTLLNESQTALFIRSLSKPLKSSDLNYAYEVNDKYRDFLNSEIADNKFFYFNPDFENDVGGFDIFSLKILYKESDNSVEFFFLMPVAGSKYANLKGDARETFENDLYTSFNRLEMAMGLRFKSIHVIDTIDSASRNCLRIVTLKEDIMKKTYLLTDLMEKRGIFESDYLSNVEYGNLRNLLVGVAPNGAVYANTKSSGSWSFMYGGGNGSGKTVATWGAIAQLIKNGCPLITVDTKNEAAQVTNSLGYMGFGGDVLEGKDYNKKGVLVDTTVPEYYYGLRFQEAYFRFYKERALRMFSERVGTGDTIKGVDDYIKNWSESNLLNLNYTIFFVDEVESMLRDSFKSKVLGSLSTTGSMARTAGIWRFYATQSPRAGELGSLLTNINYFTLGGGLSSNIVGSSLKLDYSQDVFEKVNSGYKVTSVDALNRAGTSEGLFAFYPSKNSSPMLIKTVYFKESENERSFKDFLLRYMPEGYENGVRVLESTTRDMIKSGYLEENGFAEVQDYLINHKFSGTAPSDVAYDFNDPFTDNPHNSKQEKNYNMDEDSALFDDYYSDSEDEFGFNNGSESVTEEKSNTFVDGLGESLGNNSSSVGNGSNRLHHGSVDVKIKGLGMNDFISKHSKRVSTVPVKLDLTDTLVGKKLGNFGRTFVNSDKYYDVVFNEISNLIIKQIREVVGGLHRVFEFELHEGIIIVNGEILDITIENVEGMSNPLILRHITNGTIGELFNFNYLKKFKNLNQLILSNFEYIHKLQIDIGTKSWSGVFKRFPSLHIISINGHIINRIHGNDVQSEDYKKDKRASDKSKNYVEGACKRNKRLTPTKAGLISNFYKNKRIPKAVKVIATGGTVASTALIGAYLGVVAVPLIVFGMAIKSALRGS